MKTTTKFKRGYGYDRGRLWQNDEYIASTHVIYIFGPLAQTHLLTTPLCDNESAL